MPCHAAMTDKIISLAPNDVVEDALKKLKKAGLDFAPVLDESGTLIGVFSIKNIFENLLPVSVSMSDGIQLDVQVSAAPGIAKRLKKILPARVLDLMQRKFNVVPAEAPLWEGVNLLVQSNAPVLVIESKSGRVLGAITAQSALDELSRLKDSEA